MRRLFSVIALLFPLGLFAQDVEAATWTYGGPQMEEARAMVETADGGYTLLGTTASVAGDATDYYLLHINEDLTFGWSRPLGGVESDQGRAIAQYDNGDLLLAGFSNNSIGGDYNAQIFKTTADGDVIWQKTYGGSDWDFCEDLLLLDDGGFVIAGSTYEGLGDEKIWVIRADSEGNILWEKVIDGFEKQWTEDILLNEAGHIVIAGNTADGSEGSTRPRIIELNGAGDILLDFTFGETEMAIKEIQQHEGSYACVGWHVPSGETTHDEYILGFDSDFNQIWARMESSAGDVDMWALTATDIGWVTTGPGDGFGAGGFNAYIQGRNGEGWWQQGIEMGGGLDEYPYDILLDSQDRLVICGYSESYSLFEDKDVYLLRLDSVQVLGNYIETYDSYSDISLDLPVQQVIPELSVEIYSDGLTLNLGTSEIEAALYSMAGRRVLQDKSRGSLSLSTAHLSSGIYVLQVQAEGRFHYQRIFR